MRIAILVAAMCGWLTSGLMAAESERPPEWFDTFAAAHRTALREKKPIVLFMTQDPRLLNGAGRWPTPVGNAIWVHSSSRHDALRFDYIFPAGYRIIDPGTMRSAEVVQVTPAIIAEWRIEIGVDPDTIIAKLATSERRASEFEKAPTVQLAEAHLADDDILIRALAVEFLLKQDEPRRVIARAAELLKTKHDMTRIWVCEALQKHPDRSVVPRLVELLENPGVNARALRPIRLQEAAIAALTECADPKFMIDRLKPLALRPHALSRSAVESLERLAKRDSGHRPTIDEIRAKSTVWRDIVDPLPAPFHIKGRVLSRTASKLSVDAQGRLSVGGSSDLMIVDKPDGSVLMVEYADPATQETTERYIAYSVEKDAASRLRVVEKPDPACVWTRRKIGLPQTKSWKLLEMDVFEVPTGPFHGWLLQQSPDGTEVILSENRKVKVDGFIGVTTSYDNPADGK